MFNNLKKDVDILEPSLETRYRLFRRTPVELNSGTRLSGGGTRS